MCGRTRCSLLFGFVLDELLAEFPGSSPAHFGEPIVSVQVGEYPREAAERSRRVESVTGRANLGHFDRQGRTNIAPREVRKYPGPPAGT